MRIFSFFFIVLVLAGFIIHYFIFSIYEVKIIVKPDVIFADPSYEIIVTAEPINAMGLGIPFRTLNTKFKIIEGANLVTIKLVDEENGLIVLQPKGIDGKIGIYVDSEYSLFPSYIEISVLPKTV